MTDRHRYWLIVCMAWLALSAMGCAELLTPQRGRVVSINASDGTRLEGVELGGKYRERQVRGGASLRRLSLAREQAPGRGIEYLLLARIASAEHLAMTRVAIHHGRADPMVLALQETGRHQRYAQWTADYKALLSEADVKRLANGGDLGLVFSDGNVTILVVADKRSFAFFDHVLIQGRPEVEFSGPAAIRSGFSARSVATGGWMDGFDLSGNFGPLTSQLVSHSDDYSVIRHALCRSTGADGAAGYVLLARILGPDHLRIHTMIMGGRALPARSAEQKSVISGVLDLEEVEVPLSERDVRWLAEQDQPVELQFSGRWMHTTSTLGQKELDLVRQFRRQDAGRSP
jgi:hypothetical protein